MSGDSQLPSRAWLTVGLLWFVGCLNYLDRVMITTMRGSLVEAIPMTEAQFGLLTTVFLLVYAVLSPFAGFLADRFSRSRVIIVSFVTWSAVTWMTAHAKNFEQLLLTRALMGVSEACYIPAALALIADYHRTTTRSLANGVHMSGIMVGSALGGLGGWIAERRGWADAFTIFGQIGVAMGILLIFLLRDRTDSASKSPEEPAAVKVRGSEAVRSLFGSPGFLLALAYWGLLGASVWAVVGWMPTYLNEHFNLSQGTAGLSATAYVQGASLVGVLVGGAWADRWSRTRSDGPIRVVILGLALATPSILLVANTNFFGVAIAGLIVFGLTKAFADVNMMPILTLVSDRRYRATGYGVLNFCSCTVGGLTIYAGGLLRDANVSVVKVFQVGGASFVVSIALLLLIKRSVAKNP